jgi:hypothetical protein
VFRRSGAEGILEDSAGEEPQSHLESSIFTVSKEDAKQPASEASQPLVESLVISSQPPLESTIFTVSKEETSQPLRPPLESILLLGSTEDSKEPPLQPEPPSKRLPTQSQNFAGATFTPVATEDVKQPQTQPQPLLEPALHKVSREDVEQPSSQPRNPAIISALTPSLSEHHQQSHTRVIKSAAPSSPEDDWRRFLQPPYVAPQVSLLKY